MSAECGPRGPEGSQHGGRHFGPEGAALGAGRGLSGPTPRGSAPAPQTAGAPRPRAHRAPRSRRPHAGLPRFRKHQTTECPGALRAVPQKAQGPPRVRGAHRGPPTAPAWARTAPHWAGGRGGGEGRVWLARRQEGTVQDTKHRGQQFGCGGAWGGHGGRRGPRPLPGPARRPCSPRPSRNSVTRLRLPRPGPARRSPAPRPHYRRDSGMALTTRAAAAAPGGEPKTVSV